MRTIDPTLSLKPVLDSALNSALIEIHIDHINMYIAKKVQKIIYVGFCNILNKIVNFEDIKTKINQVLGKYVF